MKPNVTSALVFSALLLPLADLAYGQQTRPNPLAAMTPVTNETLKNPPAGDWLMWRRTYDGWGYSPLDQINKDNVKNLRVAWTWSLTSGVTEIAPLVHDGVLFIWNAGDKVQALNAATGDLLWEYRRDLPPPLLTRGINTLARRNMALYGDKLIIATSDASLVALDAKTGKVVWAHTVADWKEGWSYTGGPFIAGGTVIAGMSGCGGAQPGGCFITGHDPNNGNEIWRVHTVAQPGDPNEKTWNGLPLDQRFGASAWIAGSYDPEQNTVYYGVGQPYPWIAEMRGTLPKKPGFENNALYSDSTLAIEPQTGKLKWYFQHLQNDSYDLDYAYERVLVDLPFEGVMRKALVTAGKLAIVEALDRTNGQFLWAKQTVYQNVVASIDPKTGEKTLNQAAIPHIGQTTVNCPADPGARGWPATAYSPRTQMLYLPLSEFCSNTTPTPLDPGQKYTGGGRAVYARIPVPNSDGNMGRLDAIKLTDRSQAWSVRQRASVSSAALPTAGGVVFAGSLDRWFRAYDDTTGKVLWETRTNNAVNAFPITFNVGGKQYVAVAAGNGSSQLRSLNTLTPEVKNPDGGSMLWVFALPD
ncbi:MAG TPA: PQQ-binding-like beta-propeller repeat protein [Xanthobacteraceae bacterium]|jgi:alcohol dehydrogenase (cytochrome c)